MASGQLIFMLHFTFTEKSDIRINFTKYLLSKKFRVTLIIQKLKVLKIYFQKKEAKLINCTDYRNFSNVEFRWRVLKDISEQFKMAISPLMNRFRSSRPEVFCKKGVLRDLTKLTGRHLRLSLFFSKVAGQSFLRIWSQITEEIVNGKLHFLCSAVMFVFSTFKLTSVQIFEVSQPRF